MTKSIFIKEWIKLRGFFIATLGLSLALLGYFAYALNYEFSNIEPETMMWYRFVFLDYKPYFYFQYFILGFSLLVALAQFLGERGKRLKIILHLPIRENLALSLHFAIGIAFILCMILVLFIALLLILGQFYPAPILGVFAKDFAIFILAGILSYIATTAIILESSPKALIYKLVLSLSAIFIFINLADWTAIFALILAIFCFLILSFDSLKSIKSQRLKSPILFVNIAILGVIIIFTSAQIYSQKFQKDLEKFYIFYSPILKDFVYQKNLGDHKFIYASKSGGNFDREAYEGYLPFSYWADLDLQGKLPLKIDNKIFTKEIIKDSRLGFSYDFRAKPPKIRLYPLFNPDSKIAKIPFPEKFIYVKNGIKIFDFESGIDKNLTNEILQKAQNAGAEMPFKNIWGKATNMKVANLGYLLQDKNGEIFNLVMNDNVLSFKKIPAPKNIAFIALSENAKKEFSGFAIDENSKFYMMGWDFRFSEVPLKGFDYKTMNLRFFSDPMHYQIRYDNSKTYFSNVFNKDFKLLDSIEIE
ncbi:hypothetical protein CCY99_08250 [Helicobacter sp. 16-1353]|uniref:DUF4857 domain-containing protein n=1 Tax=Helicobacter sp. 16-1353 TaxID=2004996 RepID=UPI000DCCE7DB|nr:DUF4857 domain-containing protein [Helicobacter sp. 16-1353]RAX51932.1 hypothetical protein CCY99_08250 [Helicobacter sp. 16-1353]